MKTILEDLRYAQEEPKSQAAEQARQLGLRYVGFGRYEDPQTQQVTYIIQDNKLVPFRKAVKTNEYTQSRTNDFGNFMSALSPQAQETSDFLLQSYGPENYDENELDAIDRFVNQDYASVNDLLLQLPEKISASKIQPTGPNDYFPSLIASLDSVMKKARTPIEFIAYSKMDGADMMNLVPGTEWRFKSFKSLSLNLASVIQPEDTDVIIMQVTVKKNTKGIYVADYSQTPEDSEFVLNRGTKIKIESGPNKIVGSDSSTVNKKIQYFVCSTKT